MLYENGGNSPFLIENGPLWSRMYQKQGAANVHDPSLPVSNFISLKRYQINNKHLQ